MLQAYLRSKSRQERLWDACSYGREETVKKLILQGANINWRSYLYECYPIHVASQGKPTVLKLLLDAGCDINSTDAEGNTALHHASMTGHAENVLMLLVAGASVNAQNNNLWTPLLNAAYWNCPAVTRILLHHSANPFMRNKDGRNALHELCRSKSTDSIKLADNLSAILDGMEAWKEHMSAQSEESSNTTDTLTGGINNPCHCTNDFDFEADFTPLMFACYHGHLVLVQALLRRGADINAKANNGWTALHWAAQRCHADIVELLLDYGASRSVEDLRGDMPCDVTNDLGLRECLLPNPIYPNIVSNGYVTTDDEAEDDEDSQHSNTQDKPKRVLLPPPEMDEFALLDLETHRLKLAVLEPYDSTDLSQQQQQAAAM